MNISELKRLIIFLLISGVLGLLISYLIFSNLNVSLFGVGVDIDVSFAYVLFGTDINTDSDLINNAINAIGEAPILAIREKIWTSTFVAIIFGAIMWFFTKK